MKDFLSSRTGLYAIIGVVAALLLTVTLVVLKPWSSNDTDRGVTSSGEAIPEGYTDKVTVETLDPNQAQPAQERPEELPPLIYAEGECKTTLDGLRVLFDKYPSGLTLEQAGADELNALLPELSVNCDADTALNFQNQELGPWLNYATQ